MDIGHQQQTKQFNLSEAQELLPLLKHITVAAAEDLLEVEHKLQRLLLADLRRQHYQARYKTIITRWKTKMESLGLVVESLWKIKFDVGDGYLCWQHPDLSINAYLGKSEAWEKRLPIKTIIEEFDPDWAY